ncbi:MAG: hypothetical protein ACFFDN_28070 [Candidatus Hodarchaeota archaeon]
MKDKNLIGRFILDSLQIYFPSDYYFCKFLRENGLASKNPNLKFVPIIYSDNCLSTQGLIESRRNYIIDPYHFNFHENMLKWKRIKNEQFIITAERPELHVFDEEDIIKFKIVPKPRGNNEYHIEFPYKGETPANSKWVILYLSRRVTEEFFNKMSSYYKDLYQEFRGKVHLKKEKQRNQREGMVYLQLDVSHYSFTLKNFEYAIYYLRKSGFNYKIPSIVFDSKSENCLKFMSPSLNIGYVNTQAENNFISRDLQLVFKLTQDKIILNEFEKPIKLKGEIKEIDSKENFFKIPTRIFLKVIAKLHAWKKQNIN